MDQIGSAMIRLIRQQFRNFNHFDVHAGFGDNRFCAAIDNIAAWTEHIMQVAQRLILRNQELYLFVLSFRDAIQWPIRTRSFTDTNCLLFCLFPHCFTGAGFWIRRQFPRLFRCFRIKVINILAGIHIVSAYMILRSGKATSPVKSGHLSGWISQPFRSWRVVWQHFSVQKL